jgi:N-acetyl-anhydromuramyl-L-alanine amidase AmpD
VTPLVIPGVPVQERRHSRVLQQPLASPRSGVMVHYDDSTRDDWAVAWFSDPRCTNGYTWLVLDDGRVIELADPALRTPHAGPCVTKNANSAYYGIAAATDGRTMATAAQVAAIVECIAAVFTYHKWTGGSVDERIVGHDAQAVWMPAYTANKALWGTLGRKVDPTGTRSDRVPIIDIHNVRPEVARRIG